MSSDIYNSTMNVMERSVESTIWHLIVDSFRDYVHVGNSTQIPVWNCIWSSTRNSVFSEVFERIEELNKFVDK